MSTPLLSLYNLTIKVIKNEEVFIIWVGWIPWIYIVYQ